MVYRSNTMIVLTILLLQTFFLENSTLTPTALLFCVFEICTILMVFDISECDRCRCEGFLLICCYSLRIWESWIIFSIPKYEVSLFAEACWHYPGNTAWKWTWLVSKKENYIRGESVYFLVTIWISKSSQIHNLSKLDASLVVIFRRHYDDVMFHALSSECTLHLWYHSPLSCFVVLHLKGLFLPSVCQFYDKVIKYLGKQPTATITYWFIGFRAIQSIQFTAELRPIRTKFFLLCFSSINCELNNNEPYFQLDTYSSCILIAFCS